MIVLFLFFLVVYYVSIVVCIILDIVGYVEDARIFHKTSKKQFLIGLLPFGWVGIFLVKWFLTIGEEK